MRASLGTMLGRALRRRCPRCGERKVWRSWFNLVDECPACGHRYEREDGYWVTAIIVNTAVTEVLFGILFVSVLFSTAPDIPWTPILLIAAGTNLVFPFLFFPFSKTIWVAIDLFFHPLETAD